MSSCPLYCPLLHLLMQHRNFGILIAYIIFFTATYMLAAEYLSLQPSKGEVLIFRNESKHASGKPAKQDEETGALQIHDKHQTSNNASGSNLAGMHSSIFYWKNVCYDITIKGQPRRILDNVDGWVKPGTLTALMVGPRNTFGYVQANRVKGSHWRGQNHSTRCTGGPCYNGRRHRRHAGRRYAKK